MVDRADRVASVSRRYRRALELQAAGCESLRAIAAGLEERGIPAGARWQVVRGLGRCLNF
jgi:hypothetical protein